MRREEGEEKEKEREKVWREGGRVVDLRYGR